MNRDHWLQTAATVITIVGGILYLSTTLEHRLTALETTIGMGRMARDQQVAEMRTDIGRSQGDIAQIEDVNRQQSNDILTVDAKLTNYRLQTDTAICQHWASSCPRAK